MPLKIIIYAIKICKNAKICSKIIFIFRNKRNYKCINVYTNIFISSLCVPLNRKKTKISIINVYCFNDIIFFFNLTQINCTASLKFVLYFQT